MQVSARLGRATDLSEALQKNSLTMSCETPRQDSLLCAFPPIHSSHHHNKVFFICVAYQILVLMIVSVKKSDTTESPPDDVTR